jgi:hypothetical protein
LVWVSLGASAIGLICKNPHPQGWGYTDKAPLGGLIHKNDGLDPDFGTLLEEISRTKILDLEDLRNLQH